LCCRKPLRNFFSIDPSLTTLAEVLAGKGYRTAAFVSVTCLDGDMTGLKKGFDYYSDLIVPQGALALWKAGRAAIERLGLLSFDETTQRGAAATNKCARAWLRRNGDRPYFLWVHYFDPHTPYLPPPPFDGMYRPEDFGDAAEVERAWRDRRSWRTRPDDWRADVDDARVPLALYAGEVSYTDSRLGELLADLPEDDDRGTVIMIVADHGENLGEHGLFFNHEGIYASSARIPLIIAFPGRLPGGSVVDGQVESIDVMPSILDLVRADVPEGLQGRSLIPLVEEGGRGRRYSFVEKYHASRNGPEMLSVQTEDWKLIRDGGTGTDELYHISRDPREEVDLSDDEDAILSELGEELRKWEEATPRALDVDSLKPTEDVTDQLRSLGYLD